MRVKHRMFEEHCHILHDAWWYYFHPQNYDLWQERADQLYAAMRKRVAAQKQRDEAAARPQLPTFVRDVFDDEIVWDDDFLMLDVHSLE